MEKETKTKTPHCLVIPYPTQGHINPMLQFSKRLLQKGTKITLVNTISNSKTISTINLNKSFQFETISDGFDHGGLTSAKNIETYIDTFRRTGSQTLDQLLHKLASTDNPVDCVIHDAFLPWIVDVAKKFQLPVAVFLTQACCVNSINFHAFKRWLDLPLLETEIVLPGLPKLDASDLPSFLYQYGTHPGYFDLLTNQFSMIDQADWVLANTFYELEQEVVEWLMKIWPLKTIGPCVPSMFLDKRLKDDNEYGGSIFTTNSESCIKWLDTKPKGSVVYVSFGSRASLSEDQIHELACGLKNCGRYFIWIVRETEKGKLPKGFLELSEKGLIVTWCQQLEVLEHEAVGCFVTHCGWNSTLEALSLGVPVIAMPIWTDQITNAKFFVDVWKIGVKGVADEKGIVRRETLEDCIKEMMETEKGNEMKKNAMKWKSAARNCVDEGGSSDENIADFVKELTLRGRV
ncbi:mogroside IE synthase-like [Vicia villosa]|uniref:mogroside IE synthase-like n=1 Tax=Vicia villosa TaxID=3911 RepID=UPI00273A8D35|nr:mogroside IE synthase-like [Vicia villosa]